MAEWRICIQEAAAVQALSLPAIAFLPWGCLFLGRDAVLWRCSPGRRREVKNRITDFHWLRFCRITFSILFKVTFKICPSFNVPDAV